jgi:hypothetical protein
MFPTLATSPRLIGHKLNPWTLSPAVTHANHLVTQDLGKERMMNDTSGHTLGTPLTRYDPDTQSWRTSQDTSLWDLPMSSPSLPQSGSMRNGELFERPMLARPTDASGYLSLPTPTARDYKDHQVEVAKHRPSDTDTLNRALAHLLPIPAVMDMGSNYTPQEWEAWKAKQRAVHNNGNGHGASLTQEALSIGASTALQ